jgi:hypothetical protein
MFAAGMAVNLLEFLLKELKGIFSDEMLCLGVAGGTQVSCLAEVLCCVFEAICVGCQRVASMLEFPSAASSAILSSELLYQGFMSLTYIAAGVIGSSLVTDLFRKVDRKRNIGHGIIVSAPIEIARLLFHVFRSLAGNSAPWENVVDIWKTSSDGYTIGTIYGLVIYTGILLGLIGGVTGRICSDIYAGRRGNKVWMHYNYIIVVFSTCLCVLNLQAVFYPPSTADVVLYTLAGYALSVCMGVVFGWSQHRQGCYPLNAMSRCCSQLIWIGEPNMAWPWLVISLFSTLLFCIVCSLFESHVLYS